MKIDFDKLRAALGEAVDNRLEKYFLIKKSDSVEINLKGALP